MLDHHGVLSDSSVVDPESTFQVNPDTDPDPGFWWPKIKKKKYSWNFLSKIAIYLSLCLHKGHPSYRRSLQTAKENIQHFNRWNLLTVLYFSGLFLHSWIRIRIANLEPDPGTALNFGSNPAPDPQHWWYQCSFLFIIYWRGILTNVV